jgi:hypothetical protein
VASWAMIVTLATIKTVHADTLNQIESATATTGQNGDQPIVLESSTLKLYVDIASIIDGVNPALAECIVGHESQWGNKTGDDGNSRGYWQISRIWHPEVTDTEAYSFIFSTNWSLNRIASGYIKQWSTYKKYCSNITVLINHA